MLAIVVLLLNRKKITARELAERFEVSLRTVYRDIDAINQAGIPIMSSQGNNGGFHIVENYRLNHQFLSLDNFRAILTALKGVNTTLQDRDLEMTMEKIRSLVPEDLVSDLDKQLDQFVVDFLPWGFNQRMQTRIQTINRAIMQSRMLSIDYQNLKGEASRRDVEPMTLMLKGYNWYLFAYCRFKEDGRVFRLSRIRDLELLDRTFIRRDIHFTDFTQQESSTQSLVELELKFQPSARLRVEEFFYAEQIHYQADGSMVVQAAFPEDQWIYSFILSYGPFVEVINPPHIRQLIADTAKKMLAVHQT